MVLAFRTGKMTHDETQLDAVESLWARSELVELGFTQAKPRHAAIDLERRRHRPPEAPAKGGPGVDLGEAVQNRCHPMRRALGFGSRRKAVQHEDFGLGQ